MSGYGESRWHEECFGRCSDCASCLHLDNNNIHDSNKRFVTLGSVRYGLRLGAVSPPPPGAGPRYRSQCCWPSVPGPGPGPVSRIPLLTASTINSHDIFSCVNRVRMAEDDTSEWPEPASVRDQVLYSTKTLLKSQLRRRALVRPQVYARLCECGDTEGADNSNTLDRLPRFRFGGNRGTGTNKVRERDKREQEQRLRDLTERLKRGPVPPPRTRHAASKNPQTPQTAPAEVDVIARTAPLRSASFSQVDYSTDDNKYVRRRHPAPQEDKNINSTDVDSGVALTLPRCKNPNARSNSPNERHQSVNENNTTSGTVVDGEDTINKSDMVLQDEIKQSSKTNLPERTDLTNICDGPVVRNNCANTSDADATNAQEKKRDKSRRRKGMYISQWPNNYQPTEDSLQQFDDDSNFITSEDTKRTMCTDLPKLQISSDKSDKSETCSISNLDEPLSPEENSLILEWPSTNIRPPLSAQNSEERDNVHLKGNNLRGIPLLRTDSLSEGEPDHSDRKSDQIFVPSDVSDSESRISIGNDATPGHIPRCYSKRPLRGPYGQMLEAEMKKPDANRKQLASDLKFLEDLSTGSMVSLSSSSSVGAGDPKPKYVTRSRSNANHSFDDSQLKHNVTHLLSPAKLTNVTKRKVSVDNVPSTTTVTDSEHKLEIVHQRTTSSPSKLEAFTPAEVSNELLEQLLQGSSEQLATAEANLLRHNDTRTHVVVELYDTERSYVESLQTLVTKYLEPLKSPENTGLIDATLVDEIFFQIPSLLCHHQTFLEELRKRLEHWDTKQKVGDVCLDMFSKTTVIETYTNYVNNWKRARDIIKSSKQSKPAFARFLEAMAREHKGKLALDSLLIKPIQKFPRYELLLQRLIKYTESSHPDHSLLLSAQKKVHEQLLKINCTEREALELEQLREIEGLIEGLMELVANDRQFLRHDLVSMTAGGGTRKERGLFLFSDLLLVTSIKRKSGPIRRPTTVGQSSVTSTLEANKYKLLMKIALDDLEIVRAKDENLRQMMVEIENLTEDISVLNQINELAWSLHSNHGQLDEVVKDMLANLNKQLVEQQNSDSQLSCLDLTLNTANGLENVSIVFSKPEKRASWEESFNEAKHKLAMSGDRRPCPDLVATVPIRKTRAGLQFTCATPTLGDTGKDVWVCNSDGYVGQVCILSLQPEPTVTSCNGVCNARILCVASVPGISNCSTSSSKEKVCEKSETKEEHNTTTIHFDSSSSSDDEKSDNDDNELQSRVSGTAKSTETASIDSDETDCQQSTMWLGTEDGCIHVYNSNDNIRIKKNKIRLQHGFSILCIIYLENRVFVSMANGDITIYERDGCGWNTTSPISVSVGTTTMPISKMLPNGDKLWCGCGNTIKVFNTQTLVTENSFVVNNDANKSINCIVIAGNGVWLSLQNSAIVKCFHALSFGFLCEVNVAPAVTKMLTSCDDIIRQHKAACLRVTSLLACKDLLWIGTSAGVLLTMPLPHINTTSTKLNSIPSVIGVPHGHTGHVRFLTSMEWQSQTSETHQQRHSYKGKPEQRNNTKYLVISGGDGYEDFRNSNLSEIAGREDSTNHLLLWNI